MYNNFTYVIVDSSEVDNLNFGTDQFNKRYLLNFNKEYIRYNLAKTKALVKYQGSDPIWKNDNDEDVDFFSDKVKYTHEEILTIVNTSEWTENDE